MGTGFIPVLASKIFQLSFVKIALKRVTVQVIGIVKSTNTLIQLIIATFTVKSITIIDTNTTDHSVVFLFRFVKNEVNFS